jgi:hypothetical protein
MIHAAFILLAIRTARLPIFLSTPMNAPLVLLSLPHDAPVAANAVRPGRLAAQRRLATSKPGASSPRASNPEAATSNAITVAPDLPKIDWEEEAERAAENAIANSDKENGFRDLSALSPQQLDWIRRNHMEPAQPGIAWMYRRVEITKGGFPIIHINDHCVAVPFLLMMVFCQIGHIEPNGRLFEHMRDPANP